MASTISLRMRDLARGFASALSPSSSFTSISSFSAISLAICLRGHLEEPPARRRNSSSSSASMLASFVLGEAVKKHSPLAAPEGDHPSGSRRSFPVRLAPSVA